MMRRPADLHPGQAKTDTRDAYVIATAAREHPRTLRRVGGEDDTVAELGVLAGYDDDPARQTTRLTNRLRDALLHVHPALERLLGKHIDRGGVIDLLAGTVPVTTTLCSDNAARIVPGRVLASRGDRGRTTFGRVITGVAAQLGQVRAERDRLAIELEERLDAHPVAGVLTSIPGVGFRTAIKILTIIGDGTAFATAAHLASYAGLAPVTRRSGSSIRGESHSRRGNHALKNALFLSAFAALNHPDSRAYDDRKRAEG